MNKPRIPTPIALVAFLGCVLIAVSGLTYKIFFAPEGSANSRKKNERRVQQEQPAPTPTEPVPAIVTAPPESTANPSSTPTAALPAVVAPPAPTEPVAKVSASSTEEEEEVKTENPESTANPPTTSTPAEEKPEEKPGEGQTEEAKKTKKSEPVSGEEKLINLVGSGAEKGEKEAGEKDKGEISTPKKGVDTPGAPKKQGKKVAKPSSKGGTKGVEDSPAVKDSQVATDKEPKETKPKGSQKKNKKISKKSGTATEPGDAPPPESVPGEKAPAKKSTKTGKKGRSKSPSLPTPKGESGPDVPPQYQWFKEGPLFKTSLLPEPENSFSENQGILEERLTGLRIKHGAEHLLLAQIPPGQGLDKYLSRVKASLDSLEEKTPGGSFSVFGWGQFEQPLIEILAHRSSPVAEESAPQTARVVTGTDFNGETTGATLVQSSEPLPVAPPPPSPLTGALPSGPRVDFVKGEESFKIEPLILGRDSAFRFEPDEVIRSYKSIDKELPEKPDFKPLAPKIFEITSDRRPKKPEPWQQERKKGSVARESTGTVSSEPTPVSAGPRSNPAFNKSLPADPTPTGISSLDSLLFGGDRNRQESPELARPSLESLTPVEFVGSRQGKNGELAAWGISEKVPQSPIISKDAPVGAELESNLESLLEREAPPSSVMRPVAEVSGEVESFVSME